MNASLQHILQEFYDYDSISDREFKETYPNSPYLECEYGEESEILRRLLIPFVTVKEERYR